MADSTPDSTAPTPPSCCAMRKKVRVGIISVHPEAQCGISDTVIADFLNFDGGGPTGTIAFKFCPWCGTLRARDVPAIVTPPMFREIPIAEAVRMGLVHPGTLGGVDTDDEAEDYSKIGNNAEPSEDPLEGVRDEFYADDAADGEDGVQALLGKLNELLEDHPTPEGQVPLGYVEVLAISPGKTLTGWEPTDGKKVTTVGSPLHGFQKPLMPGGWILVLPSWWAA